jgi:DNA-binding GntR family transcriptional regulator
MKLAPKTVREQVTNKIRDELVAGRFEAGTMLRETELANRLGVSRGPVRDAFIQLSYEGYLAYHANRGVMVRHPPNPEDREFITSLRQQIETHVVEKGIDDLSDESLAIVKDVLGQLKEACDSSDATKIALQDVAFHEAVLIGCGGEDLVAAWRQLCSRMLLVYTRHNNYRQSFSEHKEIYEAIAAKDKKAAIAAIKKNIQ